MTKRFYLRASLVLSFFVLFAGRSAAQEADTTRRQTGSVPLLLPVESFDPNVQGVRATPDDTAGKQGSIQVLSPNGGEVWQVGREETISWSAPGLTGDVNIQLYRKGGFLVRPLYRAGAGSGSATWTIPPYIQPGTEYYIQITSFDDPSIRDESDYFFTIDPGTGASIDVVFPNGGEILRIGESIDISWTSENLDDNITIDLLYGIALSERSITGLLSTSDDGIHSWRIPSSVEPRDNYYVGIRGASKQSVWDTSERYFTIAYPAGQENVTYAGQANTRGEAWDVVLEGNYAYVADFNRFSIVNFADPENPEVIASLPLAETIRDVAVSDGYVYLVQNEAGLVVVDVHNVFEPVYVTTWPSPGNAFGIEVIGDTGYLADSAGGLHILNLADPARPALIKTFNESGLAAVDIEVVDALAYIANYTRGLRIVDVKDPENPIGVGSIDTSEAWDVAVQGDYAYVADASSGLRIIDVSNPGAPVELSRFNTAGSTWDVAVEGNFAYLADDDQGLRILDVTDPENPVEVGYYRTLDRAYGIAAKDGYAFVAATSAGVEVVRNDSASSTTQICPFTWPDQLNAQVIFKVVAPPFLKVDSLSIDMNLLNSDRGVSKLSCILSRKVDDVTLSEYFFYFDESQLDGKKIKEIRVYNENKIQLGHLEIDDYDTSVPLDAILYLHTENDLLPSVDKRLFPGWKYYDVSILPMTMLIPPGQHVAKIDIVKSPMLFVHGLNGIFPYWGDELLVETSKDFDLWQLYYPYDQNIYKSSALLAKAIKDVLGTAGMSGIYGTNKVHIVAHSMGGLLTRDLLLSSERYENNISKFLILGTPNHGSFAAYRKYKGDTVTSLANTFPKWGGGDKNAPAFYQLAPASEFMYDLNVDRPALIANANYFDLVEDMLIIAGTNDVFAAGHDEIPGQDDGIVAVASANMWNERVPLLVLDMAHTNSILPFNQDATLKTSTAQYIKRFFVDGLYWDRDQAKSDKYLQGFWMNGTRQFPDFSSDIDFNFMPSIFTLRISGTLPVGSTVFTDLFLSVDEKEKIITVMDDGGIPQLGKIRFDFRRANNKLGMSANYFAKSFRQKNIGFDVEAGDYSLDFSKMAWPDFITYKVVDEKVPVGNTKTTMADVLLSTGESNIFLADNLLISEVAASKQGTTGRTFFIDPGIENMSIVLSNLDGVIPHDFTLTNPAGEIIDPIDANLRVGYEYKENLDAGFAFYFVPRPMQGVWTATYNADQVDAVLNVPFRGAGSLNLAYADSAYAIGDRIEVSFNDPLQGTCETPAFTPNLYFVDPETGERSALGELAVEEDAFERRIAFTPAKEGNYVVVVDYGCDTFDGTIRRRAQASFNVQEFVATGVEPDSELASTEAGYGLLPNFPNPFRDQTRLPIRLATPGHVTLRVYDLLGRHVATLIDEALPAGEHRITFDAAGLPSGTYVARLQVGDRTDRRLMTLVR